MSNMIDTLTLSRNLEEKGFTSKQAEGLAMELNGMLSTSIATSDDIERLAASLRSDLSQLEAAVKSDLSHLENTLTIKLGGIVIAAAGVLFALLRLT